MEAFRGLYSAFTSKGPYCPPKYEVPRDSEGYVQAFGLEETKEIKQFFEKFGFVVIRDVLTKEECEATIDDMWNFIKPLGIDRNDKKTWRNGNWRRTGLWTEGILGYDPIFTKRAILNRQNANLYKIFVNLFGREDLLINQDRYGLFRSTVGVEIEQDSDDDQSLADSWKTMRNVHLDMNPWSYVDEETPQHRFATSPLSLCQSEQVLGALKYQRAMDFIIENNEPGCLKDGKLNIQGLINLADNKEKDGGFHLVPGFNNHLIEWVNATRNTIRSSYSKWQTFIVLPEDEPLQDLAVRVTARAGSIVVWNQTVAHGSAPNESERCRFAQFFKVFPANPMDQNRWERRSAAVKKWIEKAGCQADITELGKKFLGIEKWK